MDRFDDCRQCNGHYTYFTKAGFEICDDCGHRRRYSDKSSWWQRAACKGVDAAIFFPPRGANNRSNWAKQICNTCPVLNQCRAYALSNGERFGIWGGLSERERRLIRAARGIIDRKCPDCGIWYERTRRGIYCDDCNTPQAHRRRNTRRQQEARNSHAS